MPTEDSTIIIQPFYLWESHYQQLSQDGMNTGIPFDFIFPPREVQAPVVRKSLFTHTTLPVKHDTLQERTSTVQPAWLFALLIVLCGLLFLYFSRLKLRIPALVQSTVDHRAMERLVRGNNLVTARLLPMGLFAIATLSTSIYLMAMAHVGITAWLLLTAGLIVAYMLRNQLIRLLGNIFEDSEATTAYITSNYMYHISLAICLTPLLFLQAYAPWSGDTVFYIVAALTLLCLTMRLIRGLKLFLTLTNSSSFYLFYYLCIVEIIPIILLVNWFFAQ